MLGMGAERANKARALAYRLYSLAERRRWTDEAHAYNIFVTSWSQIRTEAARLAAGVPEQTGFGFSSGEAPGPQPCVSHSGGLCLPADVGEVYTTAQSRWG